MPFALRFAFPSPARTSASATVRPAVPNVHRSVTQDKACLIEGRVNKVEVKDCMQHNGSIPAEQFKQSCGGMASVGGGKVTYMAACPSAAQGTCDGFINPAVSAYYYKRDAASLPDLKKSCAAMGEMQEACISGKTALAQAQGWAYDASSERWSDAELRKLESERIEEYFEGAQYAHIVSGLRFDPASMQVTREGTTHQCKWNALASERTVAGDIPAVRECTLVPSPIHAGTGRLLLAIKQLPDNVRLSTLVLSGTQKMDVQSFAYTEHAVVINLGGAIPAEKFKAPADNASFPLSDGS